MSLDQNILIEIQSELDVSADTPNSLNLTTISELTSTINGIASTNTIGLDLPFTVDTTPGLTGVLNTAGLSNVSSVIDCAKNIEDRLIAAATQKATTFLLSQLGAAGILAGIAQAQAYVNAAKALLDAVRSLTPESLVMALINAQGLSGIPQLEKLDSIVGQFGGVVNNINDIAGNIANLDICKVPNFSPSGSPLPPFSRVPEGVPSPIPQYNNPVMVDSNQIITKDAYDDLMFRLKDLITKDISRADDPGYNSMITIVNGLVMAYHTRISKTIDSVNDETYYNDYNTTVNLEKSKNANWDPALVTEFLSTTDSAGNVIKNEADTIRLFYMRNSPGPINGSLISTGVTTYSGPDKDFTTFLDIKASQRPPELTSYWTNRGYNISSQEAKLNARGIKTQTLNYSDAYNGVYGPLESDRVCASTRVPGGSVLALKNPDGTPYNPSGKNPQGVYTVADTGNSTLTYNKVDIFTSTPELYKNMGAIQVFLVSRGTKTGPQYNRAQAKYGSTSSGMV